MSNPINQSSPKNSKSESQSIYAQYRCYWDLAAPFIKTETGNTWSYGEMDKITASMSRKLISSGLGIGDRLFCLIERSPWNLFLYLSCLRAGIIYIPFNPDAKEAELEPVIADIKPHAFICSSNTKTILKKLLPSTPSHTLETDGSGTINSIIEIDTEADLAVTPHDIASIIFTSGTTGRPKGAMMPHGLFSFKGKALSDAMGWSKADCLLHVMPLHHAHGLFMAFHTVLASGASILLQNKFIAKETVNLLNQCTVFSGVPTMYGRMLECQNLKEVSTKIRLFIAASAALPPDIFHKFKARTNHEIAEGWGMSETTSNSMSPLTGIRKAGSAGIPLPGIDIKIISPSGETLGVNEVGQLALRLPIHFKGYWQRPQEEQPQYLNGFQVTHDLGRFDEDGYLFISGRVSDVIISGGYNIYPREVEGVIEKLNYVEKAVVFGIPHQEFGEAVVVAIKPTAGNTITNDHLLSHLKEHFASYKIPKAIFILDEFPLTELGKVKRGALFDKYKTHFIH